MSSNVPGALVAAKVVQVIQRDYGLPSVRIYSKHLVNPVVIISSAEKGAGRDHYTNMVTSVLRATGRAVALIEIGLEASLVLRAHKADVSGNMAATTLLRLTDPQWYPTFIDTLDRHIEHIVVVTVSALAWKSFAMAEAMLLDHVRGFRGLGYAFVCSSPEAKVPGQHQNWLRSVGADDLAQAIVVRGRPILNVPLWNVTSPAFIQLFAPELLPQVRDAMRDPAQPQTFHSAWAGATSGTHNAMMKGVLTARNEIINFVTRVTTSGMASS